MTSDKKNDQLLASITLTSSKVRKNASKVARTKEMHHKQLVWHLLLSLPFPHLLLVIARHKSLCGDTW
jgi:hypothetical protein